MRSTVAQSIGVDISKDGLDVAIHPGGEASASRTILKTSRPHQKGLKGSISRNRFRGDRGLLSPVPAGTRQGTACLGSRSTPVRPDASPQATGKLAKTDRCDVYAARMGWFLDLETRAPASKTVEVMRELVNARDALIKDRVAASAPGHRRLALIKRQLAQRLRQIDGRSSDRSTPLKTLRNADLGPVPAV